MVTAYICYFDFLTGCGQEKEKQNDTRDEESEFIEYLLTEDSFKYDEAIRYFNEAYTGILSYEKITDEMLSLGTYITDGLFRAYLRKEDLEKAWYYLEESQKLIDRQADSKNKEDDTTMHYSSLAKYYIAENDIQKALENIKCAEERYGRSNNFGYANFDIELFISYGDAYLSAKEYNTALEYYKKAEELFQTRLDGVIDSSCLEGLYNVYKETGDVEKACYYAEMMYDSLNKAYITQENQHASYILEEFQNEQNRKKIENLETKNKELVYIITMVCLLVILFMILSVIISGKSKKIAQLNGKLKEISEHDGLTGLYNRRAMNDYLSKNWENICEKELPVSMIMADVDYFKKYNDFYGHQKGDEVLCMIGKCILEQVRASDFSVRYGGEEFLIIMPGTYSDEAVRIADKIKNAVCSQHIIHEKSEVNDFVTISMGVCSTDKKETSEYVLREADCALYEAKKTRDAIVVR